MLAVTFGSLEYVQSLAQVSPRQVFAAEDKKWNTPLMLAVQASCAGWNDRKNASGADTVVEFIIEAMSSLEMSLNAANKRGKTALMMAAKGGDTATMRKLIEAGADLDIQNPYGLTALALTVQAVQYDGVERLKILLEAGAAVEIADENGLTPLMYVVSGSHFLNALERLGLE